MENSLFNKKNIQETKQEIPKIKEGVDFVFEQNPELASIGTQEQYSQYLDTIFPESKVKDVAFHGTDGNFENFNDNFLGKKDSGYYGKGFYFWIGKSALEGAQQIVFSYTNRQPVHKDIKAALLNIQNPRPTQQFDFSYTGKNFDNYDGAIIKNQVVVKSSEQIHILGSQSDIENFKKFVENKNTV